MLAAAVVVLGILGMMRVIVSGSEMLDIARKQTVAMQIIHGEIDGIRLKNWNEISVLPTSTTAVAISSSLQPVSTGFTCTRSITTVKSHLKQVTFTVTWKGNTGRAFTRSGSTYVGKNGLYVTYQRS